MNYVYQKLFGPIINRMNTNIPNIKLTSCRDLSLTEPTFFRWKVWDMATRNCVKNCLLIRKTVRHSTVHY